MHAGNYACEHVCMYTPMHVHCVSVYINLCIQVCTSLERRREIERARGSERHACTHICMRAYKGTYNCCPCCCILNMSAGFRLGASHGSDDQPDPGGSMARNQQTKGIIVYVGGTQRT